jgi:cation-transporting ATPase 13A3/4/5
MQWPEDDAVVEDSETEDESTPSDVDLESGERPTVRRKSSAYSRTSLEDPLLQHRESISSEKGRSGRTSQKVYIITEDLTIVVAGFTTSTFGILVYFAFCACTLGLGYLLLRWLPRWRVRMIGCPSALGHCSWVVIEVS